jgi:NADH-quinone oxidoreductase subunit J
MDAFFFWLFAAGMIGFSLAVVLGRNPVGSALCFAVSMIFMAALFVMLSAFFLAAIQILVTAGAVMVLFLFIIMLLDIGAMSQLPRQRIWLIGTFILALAFVVILARVLDANPQGTATTSSLPNPPKTFVVEPHPTWLQQNMIEAGQMKQPGPVRESDDDTHRIGRMLFTKYVAPFEITSLLILVATVGVVVLCKEEPTVRRKTDEEVDAAPHPKETGPALTTASR